MNRLDALHPREKDGKTYWTKLGVAWPSKTTEGEFTVKLEAIPAPGPDGLYTIVCKIPKPRDGAKTSPGGELDDNIPF